MNGKIRVCKTSSLLLLLVLILSACASQPVPEAPSPGEEGNVVSGEEVTIIPDEEGAIVPGGELTFEEHRAAAPPPPKDLNINPEGNGVQITWEPSDKVMDPHGYGDEVLFYKVFRRAEGSIELSQLGTTTETSFLDAKRTAEDEYYYSVVAVHKGVDGGEVDGDRSDEVFWGG